MELAEDALRSGKIALEAPGPVFGAPSVPPAALFGANVIAVPSAHKIPAGQALHELDPLKLALPVAHERHSSAPRTRANCPPGHGIHAAVPPTVPPLKWPDAHLVHDAAPATDPKRPLSHGRHIALSVFE